jgi:tRNA threonylcarbamoyladenosine biosynthesis protein TsaE
MAQYPIFLLFAMSALGSRRLYLPDESATEALARHLARVMSAAADTAGQGGRIYFQGDLGAGKTAFVRALLRESGIEGRIKSPSYALLEPYKVSNLYFYHLDFYRFSDSHEWLDAGFRDLLRDDAVVLIEWPERAQSLLPPPDLEIFLDYASLGRDATLNAYTDRGLTWLSAIHAPDPPLSCLLPPPPAGA